MRVSLEQLDAIFQRTTGYCHLCHKQLCRGNYGKHGRRGAWQIEHSVPQSKGGSDHLNNLFAACIPCNLLKSNRTTRTARRWAGKTRAPLSPERRATEKVKNGVAYAAVGAGIGAVLAGPPGAWLGGVIGATVGSDRNPDLD